MLNALIQIAQLPAKATVEALKQTTSPQALNRLSTAIAQASLQTVDADEKLDVQGITVTIDFNEERLLTTAGISTAIALGTVYWIGEKLRIQFRYARMVEELTTLRRAIASADNSLTNQTLRNIDLISNPLLDPETLLPIEEADELRAIYEQLFDRPAVNGSMFNTSTFVNNVDEGIQFLDTLGFTDDALKARSLVLSQTDEVLESMTKKAAGVAKTGASRALGAVLWIDTVWWVATSAIDLGLNFFDIPEEQQRIPILADIPFIGALFDLSDSVGSSFVDVAITPILDGIISLFSVEDEVEALVDTMWAIITSAVVNPTLAPFIIAILDFYIDDVGIEFELPAVFDIQSFAEIDYKIDLYKLRPEPLDILVVWLYLISGKIVFKFWIQPFYRFVMKKAPTNA